MVKVVFQEGVYVRGFRKGIEAFGFLSGDTSDSMLSSKTM